MRLLRPALLGSAFLWLIVVATSAPATASWIEPTDLLATNEGDAWAFVATAKGRDGAVVVLDVSRTLLGTPDGTVKLDQAHVAQGDRMQVDGEYVVVIVDPDEGAIQRPDSECTLVWE